MSEETQFAGFAALLYEELANAAPVYLDGVIRRGQLSRAQCEQIIARRAYDLAYHTLSHTTQGMAADCESISQIAETVASIPDMTTWPED